VAIPAGLDVERLFAAAARLSASGRFLRAGGRRIQGANEEGGGGRGTGPARPYISRGSPPREGRNG